MTSYFHTAFKFKDPEEFCWLVSARRLLIISRSDLILWLPNRKGYQNWAKGYIAISLTSTVFANDAGGKELTLGKNAD